MTVSLEHVHMLWAVQGLQTSVGCGGSPRYLAVSQLQAADENGGEQGAKGEDRKAEGRKRKLLWLKWTIIY